MPSVAETLQGILMRRATEQHDAQALAHQQEQERLAREQEQRMAEAATQAQRVQNEQLKIQQAAADRAAQTYEQGQHQIGEELTPDMTRNLPPSTVQPGNPAIAGVPGIIAAAPTRVNVGGTDMQFPGAEGRAATPSSPATPTTYKGNEKQQAMSELMKNEKITPEIRQMIRAGVLDDTALARLLSPAGPVKSPRDLYLSRSGGMELIENGKRVPLPADFVRRAEDVVHQEPAPSTAGAVTVNLGDQGLDMTAKMYAKTGQLPSLGMGAAAASTRGKIIERAAQYDPATDTFSATNTAPDLASNKAGYTSDSAALSQLNKNYQAVGAFKATANKNAALLNEMLDKIPSGHAPTFINMPLRAAASAFGDTDMARFNALRLSVQNEYARLVSNPNLVGVMTDQSRKEMESVLNPNATVGQVRAALQALKDEAESREAGFHDQIQSLHDRIKGGPEKTTAPAAPTALPKSKYKVTVSQ